MVAMFVILTVGLMIKVGPEYGMVMAVCAVAWAIYDVAFAIKESHI